MNEMIEKNVAIDALKNLVDDLAPYINGLDSEEIAEIYIKYRNTLK